MPVQVDGSSQSNGASIYQAAVGGIAQIKRVGLMVPKAKGHAEQCTLLNSKCLRMIPILEVRTIRGSGARASRPPPPPAPCSRLVFSQYTTV
mmetsp:Transcript_30829/g.98441  ORF Transcript_30829/g.98441 Transcript_30829/m.98441 type:complete len:92 (+) Transcript_30829:237-512(+)